MLPKLKQIIEGDQYFTMLAIGSSNTQRFQAGMHWFDYVELGFKIKCKWHSFINSGVSGNTSTELLERFDRNLACYKPDVVIVTVGGNDSSIEKNVSPELFKNNLIELYEKITKLGGIVIFQTYYACDYERMEEDKIGSGDRMLQYMQIIRDTANELNCDLLDHYSRWEKLRVQDVDLYRILMRDSMHVNAFGNMVLGLDLARFFGIKWREEDKQAFEKGLLMTSFLDKISD